MGRKAELKILVDAAHAKWLHWAPTNVIGANHVHDPTSEAAGSTQWIKLFRVNGQFATEIEVWQWTETFFMERNENDSIGSHIIENVRRCKVTCGEYILCVVDAASRLIGKGGSKLSSGLADSSLPKMPQKMCSSF